ncbi:MAG: YceI family protein [Flavobacteriales bacterium]|jgi:polyisoprenoid-binding protein YceI|nr:YceI family protein [Flavobacteriales bacterium]MBK7941226.1 YceI family protein [Flavobacteriales bacterium]MBK8948700.1 YceI family protein [Flavobacteriales bacterium]MBK9701254.1 YceI family protein [Flavobacteriales bacterium]
MKLQLFSATAMVALTLASCGGGSTAEGEGAIDSAASMAAKEVTYAVDIAASKLTWKGVMIGVKYHEGTMAFTEGSFTAKGGQLVSGGFVVDMKSMMPVDTNYNKDYTKEKLTGHLASPDFFAVDSFPTASFKVTSVSGNTATGELNVRGRMATETVTDIVISEENGMANASGKLVFNRQKYGVSWANPMKDMVLSDDIEIVVSLVGKGQ